MDITEMKCTGNAAYIHTLLYNHVVGLYVELYQATLKLNWYWQLHVLDLVPKAFVGVLIRNIKYVHMHKMYSFQLAACDNREKH